jgi:hypothetical protein
MRKDTAYLARAMTMPWYKSGRDGNGHEDDLCWWTPQDIVHSSSFQAADYEVPWILELFEIWVRKRVPDYYHECEFASITPEMFDKARDFVHRCAVENVDAEWCPS